MSPVAFCRSLCSSPPSSFLCQISEAATPLLAELSAFSKRMESIRDVFRKMGMSDDTTAVPVNPLLTPTESELPTSDRLAKSLDYARILLDDAHRQVGAGKGGVGEAVLGKRGGLPYVTGPTQKRARRGRRPLVPLF